MTWILNGDLANPIEDIAPFKGADGTSYPGNWDKSTFPGMARVVETDRPDETLNVVTGSEVQFVNSVPTRAWLTSQRSLENVKRNKKAKAADALTAKLSLGFVFNTKTYQVGGAHSENARLFFNAYNYFWANILAWATSTAYVVGDIRRSARVFYKCAQDHTSGTFVDDLAAGKWTIWYFHPHKDGDGKWRDMANGMNPLTTEQAKAMCEGLLDYEMRCKAKYVAHKDAIDALTESAAVVAHDETAGYPANS